MKFYDLTQRIVWDYDKGRSECPERWNDPLDYEKDCEEHYMLTRGVEVIEEDAIYLFGEYMSSVDDVFDSSIVITPSLPTFSIASAMSSPICATEKLGRV